MTERPPDFDDAAEIARLNDTFRQNLLGGKILITPGVAALAQLTQFRAFQAIQNF